MGHLEAQLQVREKAVVEAEERVRRSALEMEKQREKLTDLQRQMERDVEARRERESLEEDRLQREHQRLLELQQAVRSAERVSLQALTQRKATSDEERRDLLQAKANIQAELSARKEELDERERQLHLEKDKVLAMRREVETLGQNCRRRVAETEAIVSAERQKLVVDMEVLEQKQRQLQNGLAELARLRRSFGEEKDTFAEEANQLSLQARQVEQQSAEVARLSHDVDNGRREMRSLFDQIQNEKASRSKVQHDLQDERYGIELQRLELMRYELRSREIYSLPDFAPGQQLASPPLSPRLPDVPPPAPDPPAVTGQ